MDDLTNENTLLKRLKLRFENNPVIAAIMILSIVVGGFAAFSKSIADIAALFSVEQFPVGTPEHPIRLKPNDVKKLIIEMVERGKLVNPTHPEFEGRSNTWYSAYYYKNGQMLYLKSVSRSLPEKWEWYMDKNGNLCRGPINSKSRSCRSIESVEKGRYRSVGYRTGTVRNEFYIEQGTPDDIR